MSRILGHFFKKFIVIKANLLAERIIQMSRNALIFDIKNYQKIISKFCDTFHEFQRLRTSDILALLFASRT